MVVMFAGEIVLDGSVRQALLKPVHSYARSLLASIPKSPEASLPAALDGRPPALVMLVRAVPLLNAVQWQKIVAARKEPCRRSRSQANASGAIYLKRLKSDCPHWWLNNSQLRP